MALFGDIQVLGNPDLHGMNSDVNFTNFYLAMIMLFRISTGESWNNLMHDCFSGARCAEPPHHRDCGNTVVSVIFFVSFMVAGSFVFVNLFIAVIIEKLFQYEQDEGSDQLTLMTHDLECFVESWARIAPDGCKYIPTVMLPQLLQDVDPPLGWKGENMRTSAMIRCVSRLGIRDHGGKVEFYETLWRLASVVSGADMREAAHSAFLKDINERVMRAWPMPHGERCRVGIMHLAAEVIVATRVQGLWRTKLAQRSFFKFIRDAKAAREGLGESKQEGEDTSVAQVQALQEPINSRASESEDPNYHDGQELSPPSAPFVVTKLEKYEDRQLADAVSRTTNLQDSWPETASLAEPISPSILTSVLLSCSNVPAWMDGCAKSQTPRNSEVDINAELIVQEPLDTASQSACVSTGSSKKQLLVL